MSGSRTAGGELHLKGNEFVLFSVSMVMILLVVAISEYRPVEVPAWALEREYLGEYTGKAPEKGEGELVEASYVLLDSKGATAEGGSSEQAFTIDRERALNVTIELSWSDDYGNNDEFMLTVSNSTGEVATGSANAGIVTVSFDRTGEGWLEGDFNISVKAVVCPGIVESNPYDLDGGNDWAMVATVVVLEAPED